MTGLVISRNTEELLRNSLESVERFYPDIPVLVIDGSDPEDKCYEYVKSLPNKVQFGYNIGHGKGMNVGITLIDDDEILIFDSDIVMLKPCIEQMVELMEDDTFGVGEVFIESKWGFGKIPYIHPYFHIINKRNYMSYKPYVHSGAPTILTSIDIYKKGLSDKVLKNFPLKEFIRHDWMGTRSIMQKDLKRVFGTQTLARRHF